MDSPASSEGDEAPVPAPVFVLPFRASGYRRPMAPWITTAGLAGAARRRFGDARIVSPDGWFTVEEALANATVDAGGTAAPSHARRPRWRTAPRAAAADARKVVRNRRFGSDIPVPPVPVPFVWQRHDLGVSARSLADRADAPLIVSVHALVGRERRAWRDPSATWSAALERVGERPALRHADLVSCVSADLADQVRALGVPPERVVVTPNGVDVDAFSPAVDGTAVRAELGLDGRVAVGWIGSFRPFHGLDELLRAWVEVERRCPAATLVLVGSGQEQAPLEALAVELGLRSVVWAGPRPFADMPEVLAAMDVGVIAGGSGSFHYSPVKLREYLASGLAVVAPRAGELGRNFGGGDEVVLVAPGEVDDLAAALTDLVDDPARRAALGARGRHWVERHASWDAELDGLLRALHLAGRWDRR